MSRHPESANLTTAIAVVCHPHPLYGGTMKNKVVYTLVKSFEQLGLDTVCFNFRGVGQSAGYYDEGRGEVADLLAVLEWIKQVAPQKSIWLAGFSFGSYIAACGALAWPTIEKLICVAPPIENFPFKALASFPCPWWLIQGDKDEVVSAEAVFDWEKTLMNRPHLLCLAGASHFFHGRLVELRERLVESLSIEFDPSDPGSNSQTDE
ncbi:alpha/beta hydrolase [Rickettsiella massiliensis]|uniref:alpha/beta hydrolase n=1 Tax=Rickettsiella massiliensis TaxID=676517 RepID=UPI001F34E7C5|nr:alpha/beta fold hydrolase [Rickettsiella massiliensis]